MSAAIMVHRSQLGSNSLPSPVLSPSSSRSSSSTSSARCLILIVTAVLSIFVVVFLSSNIWESSTSPSSSNPSSTSSTSSSSSSSLSTDKRNRKYTTLTVDTVDDDTESTKKVSYDRNHQSSFHRLRNSKDPSVDKLVHSTVDEEEEEKPAITDEGEKEEEEEEEPNESSLNIEDPEKEQEEEDDDDDGLTKEERKRRRKARKQKRKMEKLRKKRAHDEEKEPGTLPEKEFVEGEEEGTEPVPSASASSTPVPSASSSSTPLPLRDLSRLKVTVPGIVTTVEHKLDLLSTYKNSQEAGAPTSCTPALHGQLFPQDFVQSSGSLPPLHYPDAIKELHSTKVWLTAKIDQSSNNDQLVERTRMASRSLSKYCNNRQYFRPDHVPEGGCPNEKGPFPPSFNYPWCFPPTDPVHIMSIDCGIVENYIVHEDIAFTVFNDKVVVATDRERWKVLSNVLVEEYDELACMGAAEYPTEPGHFPNEDLHALLYLDHALPSRIPLLWPNGGIASHMLDSLREEKLMNPDRTIILVGPRHAKSYYRAKRLYFFRSNRAWGQAPFISWYGQRFVQQLLFPVLERRLQQKKVTEIERKLSIVVMQRNGGSRVLTNHDELMARLQQWIPDAKIQAFVPGPGSGHPMWDTAERIYSSCLLIGPHGGNMPNELYLKQGCWVIEIGFVDAGFALPTDFYCFSRNLGQKYWLSVGEGSYGGYLTADLDDISEIVQAYKREVLLRKD